MFHVTLSGEDQQVLAEALECYISELHTEIKHTDDFEFRRLLKSREQVLRRILDDVQREQIAA